MKKNFYLFLATITIATTCAYASISTPATAKSDAPITGVCVPGHPCVNDVQITGVCVPGHPCVNDVQITGVCVPGHPCVIE